MINKFMVIPFVLPIMGSIMSILKSKSMMITLLSFELIGLVNFMMINFLFPNMKLILIMVTFLMLESVLMLILYTCLIREFGMETTAEVL
uniref:NADH dehydrogenase subunit 4L n=1 Tax=Heterodoxus spiniger TaxID=762516 RepID=A0A7T1HEY1_9NEOP|nr:NADH dehydrogenase subunit 4L [Heterodoxus spiniger]